MGFSSQPPAPGDEAYKATFRFIGQLGEVVLIQRAPPWTDFLPGATISERTQALTALERDQARVNNLKLFLAVDATDPADRGQLNSLPDNLKGHDFSDPGIRSAFIAYAQYLALNYKPAYLALGVEMDLFYGRARRRALPQLPERLLRGLRRREALLAPHARLPDFSVRRHDRRVAQR